MWCGVWGDPGVHGVKCGVTWGMWGGVWGDLGACGGTWCRMWGDLQASSPKHPGILTPAVYFLKNHSVVRGEKSVAAVCPAGTCLARPTRRAVSDQRPGTCVGCSPVTPFSLEGPWLLVCLPAPHLGFPGTSHSPALVCYSGAEGENRTGQDPLPQGWGAGGTTRTTNTHRFDPGLLPLSCFLTSLSFCFMYCSLYHKHHISVDL